VHDDRRERPLADRVDAAGPAVDLDVAESVERECRLEDVVAAAQREAIGRGGAAQRTRAELVVLEHLGVTQGDDAAGLAAHRDAHPAHEVLTVVEEHPAAGRRGDRDGRELLLAAYGRADVGLEQAEVELELVYAGPRVGDEARKPPLVAAQPRVDGLPVVEVVRGGRRGTGRPRGIRADDLLVAVGEAHPQLGERAELLAVVLRAAGPREAAAVPAVAERDAHDGLGSDERGDVVLGVAHAPLVARPARREQVVGDGAPVDPGLADAERRKQERGPGDGAVAVIETHLAAQERGAREVVVGGDHARVPLGHGDLPVRIVVEERAGRTGRMKRFNQRTPKASDRLAFILR
jgi:hypothetical protein